MIIITIMTLKLFATYLQYHQNDSQATIMVSPLFRKPLLLNTTITSTVKTIRITNTLSTTPTMITITVATSWSSSLLTPIWRWHHVGVLKGAVYATYSDENFLNEKLSITSVKISIRTFCVQKVNMISKRKYFLLFVVSLFYLILL